MRLPRESEAEEESQAPESQAIASVGDGGAGLRGSIHLVASASDVLSGISTVRYPCALREVHWSVGSMRRALQTMLLRAGLAPLDVLRAWDSSHDGAFSQKVS